MDAPVDLLTFLELKSFSRSWQQLGLSDQDLSLLQALIMVNPRSAPVIPESYGLRKMRCGRNDKGKSSGFRVCYVYFEEFATVLLVIIYSKNEMDDIPKEKMHAINQAIHRIESRLKISTYRFVPKKG